MNPLPIRNNFRGAGFCENKMYLVFYGNPGLGRREVHPPPPGLGKGPPFHSAAQQPSMEAI